MTGEERWEENRGYTPFYNRHGKVAILAAADFLISMERKRSAVFT